MGIIEKNELLKSFKNVLPYLPTFFDEDISFSITNREQFIVVQNSENMPINAQVGTPIPKGGALIEALQSEKVAVKEIDSKVYGMPLKSYALPIKDEYGKVVGLVVAGKSTEKKEDLLAVSQNLTASFQEILSSVQEMAKSLDEIFQLNQKIIDDVKETIAQTEETDQVIEFVESISTKTNILGLNAAIEASRVGDAGRGFSVVAKEIRNLSNSTNESIKKIDDVLKKLVESINNISTKVTETNSYFATQAEAFKKITGSIKEISSSADFMEELASKL